MIADKDIAIIGAGPGGAAAALKLAYEGIPSTLIDKDSFPRDKICGDGISGKTIYALNRINPEITEHFRQSDDLMNPSWGIKFFFPKNRHVTIAHPALGKEDLSDIKPSGYISTRLDFDELLMSYVRKEPLIKLVQNFGVSDISKEKDEWTIKSKRADKIHCKMILAADGAHSVFSRKYLKMDIPPSHYAAAVRWYWEGLEEENEYQFLELHFLKELLPGYFWIFPLGNGRANVGLGMRSDVISKNKYNLKKLIKQVVEEHPELSKRFKNGKPSDQIRGFGLPLGSRKVPLYGDGYMLIGDAAWLIDPLTGEGIPNALLSGLWAAETIVKHASKGEYRSSQFTSYEKQVRDRLDLELKISRQLQQLFQYRPLVNIASRIAHNNPKFEEILASMFTNVDLRKKLRNPLFYLGLLTKR